MLTDKHISQFNEACLELYRPVLGTGNFAERSYRFLEKLVPAEFIAFGAVDLETQQLDIGFNNPVSEFPKAMDAFGALMGKYDLFKWDPGVNGGKPFVRSDFFSRRQFRDLDIYAEVYQRLGIDDHCAVLIPGTEGEVAFFGIERYKGPDFSPEERQLLQFAQSHLSNARELAKANSSLGHKGASPQPLADHGLTNREAEVLAWLAEGKSNEEIAILLNLQLYTVKGYVKTIFRKIGAPNRLAAALWALRICRESETRILNAGPEHSVPVVLH